MRDVSSVRTMLPCLLCASSAGPRVASTAQIAGDGAESQDLDGDAEVMLGRMRKPPLLQEADSKVRGSTPDDDTRSTCCGGTVALWTRARGARKRTSCYRGSASPSATTQRSVPPVAGDAELRAACGRAYPRAHAPQLGLPRLLPAERVWSMRLWPQGRSPPAAKAIWGRL